jgi:hypothetical protein
MNGIDPDRFDPYKEMADAALPYLHTVERTKRWIVAMVRYGLFILFLAGAIFFLWRSWSSPANSYSESVCLELSSGFAFFWIAPYVLAWGRLHRRLVPVLGGCAAGTLLYIAHECDGFLQSVLIEFSIAMFILIALELAMTPWLDRIARKHEDLKTRLDALESRFD